MKMPITCGGEAHKRADGNERLGLGALQLMSGGARGYVLIEYSGQTSS